VIVGLGDDVTEERRFRKRYPDDRQPRRLRLLGKQRDFIMLHEQMVFSEKGDEPDAGTPKVKSTVPVRPCRSPERIQRPTPSRFPQYAPRSQRRSFQSWRAGTAA
jgi:hypothetical protein